MAYLLAHLAVAQAVLDSGAALIRHMKDVLYARLAPEPKYKASVYSFEVFERFIRDTAASFVAANNKFME